MMHFGEEMDCDAPTGRQRIGRPFFASLKTLGAGLRVGHQRGLCRTEPSVRALNGPCVEHDENRFGGHLPHHVISMRGSGRKDRRQ
jgi:hypothetical protein